MVEVKNTIYSILHSLIGNQYAKMLSEKNCKWRYGFNKGIKIKKQYTIRNSFHLDEISKYRKFCK